MKTKKLKRKLNKCRRRRDDAEAVAFLMNRECDDLKRIVRAMTADYQFLIKQYAELIETHGLIHKQP